MEKKWRELRPVGRFSRESKCGKCAEEKLSSFAKLCRSWNLWLMLEQNWKSLIHFSASADNHFDPHKYSKLYGAAVCARHRWRRHCAAWLNPAGKRRQYNFFTRFIKRVKKGWKKEKLTLLIKSKFINWIIFI